MDLVLQDALALCLVISILVILSIIQEVVDGHSAWEGQLIRGYDIMAGQLTCLDHLNLELVAAYRVIELVALLLVSSLMGLDGEHLKDRSD